MNGEDSKLGTCDGCHTTTRLVHWYRGLWLGRKCPDRCWRKRKRIYAEQQTAARRRKEKV